MQQLNFVGLVNPTYITDKLFYDVIDKTAQKANELGK